MEHQRPGTVEMVLRPTRFMQHGDAKPFVKEDLKYYFISDSLHGIKPQFHSPMN